MEASASFFELEIIVYSALSTLNEEEDKTNFIEGTHAANSCYVPVVPHCISYRCNSFRRYVTFI